MIYLIDKENRDLFRNILDNMFQHRASMFVDRLKWDLQAVDGQEKDQFDTDDTIYLVLVDDRTGELRSSLRLNPTLKSHLMSDLFSALCENGVPRGEEIWEISRYCSNPEIYSRQEKIQVFNELLCGVLECSLIYGWGKLTFVVGLPILPHCLRCGWDISPLGLPQKDKSGSICAFEVNVTPAGLQALRNHAHVDGPTLKIIPNKQFAA